MLTPLVLTLLLAKPTPSPAPSPEVPPLEERFRQTCEDERDSCRSSCSLDFGSQPSTQKQLVECLLRCDEHNDVCLMRMTARQRELAEQAAAKRDGGGRADGGTGEEMPATPYTLPSPRSLAPDAGAPPSRNHKRKVLPARTTSKGVPKEASSSASKSTAGSASGVSPSDKLAPSPLKPGSPDKSDRAGPRPRTTP